MQNNTGSSGKAPRQLIWVVLIRAARLGRKAGLSWLWGRVWGRGRAGRLPRGVNPPPPARALSEVRACRALSCRRFGVDGAEKWHFLPGSPHLLSSGGFGARGEPRQRARGCLYPAEQQRHSCLDRDGWTDMSSPLPAPVGLLGQEKSWQYQGPSRQGLNARQHMRWLWASQGT